jgi:hypothetical protein
MNGSGFSPTGDGAPRPHGGATGAPRQSRARARLRELSGAKQSGGARGSHSMVLGGRFGSLRASSDVLLLFKAAGGGLLRWASIQGEGWGSTRGIRLCFCPKLGPKSQISQNVQFCPEQKFSSPNNFQSS